MVALASKVIHLDALIHVGLKIIQQFFAAFLVALGEIQQLM